MKLRLKANFFFISFHRAQKGFTALHLAAKYGNIQVAKLLLARQAPIDAQGKVTNDQKYLLLQQQQQQHLRSVVGQDQYDSWTAADRRRKVYGRLGSANSVRDSLPDFEKSLQENLIEQEQLWH